MLAQNILYCKERKNMINKEIKCATSNICIKI